MTGRCCGCGECSSPSPSDGVLRRSKPGARTGYQHRRSNSAKHTSLDTGHRRRQSKPWFDDDYIVERCGSVETIHEERSHKGHGTIGDDAHGQYASIEQALKNMQSVRRGMQKGIDEMRCQIYQIKFCSSKFKQKRLARHRLLDTIPPTLLEQSMHSHKNSDCIASARDALYESSRSGTEHCPDDLLGAHRNSGCGSDEADFVSPRRTPNPSEKQETAWIYRPSSNKKRSNNSEVCNRPTSPSVTGQFREHMKSITETVMDLTGTMENMGMDIEMTPSPRMHNYPTKGFKTDVVLNLHSHCEKSSKREQGKKGTGLNKLVDMLARARRGRRHTQSMPVTQSASPRLQANRKAKTQRRWHRRISGVQRNDMSSVTCKFTDKYPIDVHRWGRMQCFSPVHKGSKVMLDAEGTVAASRGEETSFVLCAEGIAAGVACFDLECQYLNDWCFVGVVSKKAVLKHGGPVSKSSMSYGWSNREERFTNGVPSTDSGLRRFTIGTHLQIIVNAETGTLHCRFASNRRSNASQSDIKENEVLSLPKNMEWTLAIEWKGTGRFELNGVQVWQ